MRCEASSVCRDRTSGPRVLAGVLAEYLQVAPRRSRVDRADVRRLAVMAQGLRELAGEGRVTAAAARPYSFQGRPYYSTAPPAWRPSPGAGRGDIYRNPRFREANPWDSLFERRESQRRFRNV